MHFIPTAVCTGDLGTLLVQINKFVVVVGVVVLVFVQAFRIFVPSDLLGFKKVSRQKSLIHFVSHILNPNKTSP